MAANIISQDELKALLHYDPDTGVFTWRVDRRGKAKAGTIAGNINGRGYINIEISSKSYIAHRLVWLYVYGTLPIAQIDHLNGTRTDNRLNNLREATSAENSQNKAKYGNNTSGYPGVHPSNGKWRASIRIDRKLIHLGYFTTPEAAYKAYLKAKAKIHEFQPVPREEQ